jgi:hypothetical protein
MKKRLRPVLFLLIGLFLAFVIADALGVFDRRSYFEVPHGSHSHYVPHDRDPDVPIGQFPTRPPGPSERITPQGQIVPE